MIYGISIVFGIFPNGTSFSNQYLDTRDKWNGLSSPTWYLARKRFFVRHFFTCPRVPFPLEAANPALSEKKLDELQDLNTAVITIYMQ